MALCEPPYTVRIKTHGKDEIQPDSKKQSHSVCLALGKSEPQQQQQQQQWLPERIPLTAHFQLCRREGGDERQDWSLGFPTVDHTVREEEEAWEHISSHCNVRCLSVPAVIHNVTSCFFAYSADTASQKHCCCRDVCVCVCESSEITAARVNGS